MKKESACSGPFISRLFVSVGLSEPARIEPVPLIRENQAGVSVVTWMDGLIRCGGSEGGAAPPISYK